jgi:P27 family predicted phage terminase small subunit
MGQRGPKPLPANVHLLHGNASKKPMSQLLDGVHPEVEIPKCPTHLQAEAKKEWKRVAEQLESLGLISQIDRAALAAYCAAWAEVVYCEKKVADLNAADPNGEAGMIWDTPSGYKQMSVWLQIRNRAYDRMMKFAAEFGMSPSARTRVTPSDNQLNLPGIETPEKPKTGWGAI